jgi:hypothetical protein
VLHEHNAQSRVQQHAELGGRNVVRQCTDARHVANGELVSGLHEFRSVGGPDNRVAVEAERSVGG